MLALLVHRLHHGTDDPGKHRTTARAASKTPGLSASKMVPSIIGEDLTIRGNVTSKGELQVDGEIEGDIRCGSLLLGDKAHVRGGVVAEDVVVRGHIVGSIAALQGQCHVEGDILSQTLAIEQGAYFEGKSRRSDNPLAEIKAPGENGSASSGIPRVHRAWRLPSRRNSEWLLSKESASRAAFESRPHVPSSEAARLGDTHTKMQKTTHTNSFSSVSCISRVWFGASPVVLPRASGTLWPGALVRSRKLECRE